MASQRTAARIEGYRRALTNPNVRALLRVLRDGESSQDADAYRWLYGSTRARPKLFDSFDEHPRVKTYEKWDGQFIKNGKIDFTTAAGAYQIVALTWDTTVKSMISPPSFSPEWQDLAAVALIDFRGALEDVIAGRFEAALVKLRDEWASLPTATVGQPKVGMERARRVYEQWGGTFAPATPVAPTPVLTPPPAPSAPLVQPGPEPADYYAPSGEAPEWVPPPPKEKPMAPFIAAALPALIQAAPALIRVFGDSPQAERNAKAAEVVADIAMRSTGTDTAEGAVRAIETKPEAAAAYREAVHQSLPELLNLIARATDIDEKTRASALDRNLQLGQATGGRWLWLLGTVVIIVIVASYAITTGVLFDWGKTVKFTPETKALLLGQIVIFGFVTVLAWLFGSNIANRLSQQANLTKGQQ